MSQTTPTIYAGQTRMVPKVSVIMSVYNGDLYLKEAVDSILNQTYSDFEFLIIDDGSIDNSLKLLKRYANQHFSVRLISRENRGLTPTLNEMLHLAQGEFIARMDADDVAMPDRFARQVEFLEKHSDVVCVGGDYLQIDDGGRVLGLRQQPKGNDDIQQLALCGHTPINHPSMMIRRDAMLSIGGYDETFTSSQDLDLLLKLGEVGQLENLDIVVLKYRWHCATISDRKQHQQIENKRKACENAWQRRGIQGQFTATQPWRPTDPFSLHALLIRYGWQFFQDNQYGSAIAYGLKSIKVCPLKRSGWKLLLYALLKKLRKELVPWGSHQRFQ